MERSYQGYASFLLLIGLSQEAHSYSTQRFEIIRAGAKRQVKLVISFRQSTLTQGGVMDDNKNEITNKPSALEKGLKPMFSNTSMPPVKSPKKKDETVNEVSEGNKQQDKENNVAATPADTGEVNHDKSK